MVILSNLADAWKSDERGKENLENCCFTPKLNGRGHRRSTNRAELKIERGEGPTGTGEESNRLISSTIIICCLKSASRYPGTERARVKGKEKRERESRSGSTEEDIKGGNRE